VRGPCGPRFLLGVVFGRVRGKILYAAVVLYAYLGSLALLGMTWWLERFDVTSIFQERCDEEKIEGEDY
jgi:hypothetical protein